LVAQEQPRETTPGAGREHDRVAVELIGAVRDRLASRAEEHSEFRVRFHKPRCPFEIRACPVE
jgi:hypothetical protein